MNISWFLSNLKFNWCVVVPCVQHIAFGFEAQMLLLFLTCAMLGLFAIFHKYCPQVHIGSSDSHQLHTNYRKLIPIIVLNNLPSHALCNGPTIAEH